MHVILVVRVWHDDATRPTEPGRVADKDRLCAGCNETVEEILGEVTVDLARCDWCAQMPITPRVVDIHVEAVLVRDVLVHSAAATKAEITDDNPWRLGVRGPVGTDHGQDRPDRVLVAEEPMSQIRNAVGVRGPGDPIGPVVRELRPFDQTA